MSKKKRNSMLESVMSVDADVTDVSYASNARVEQKNIKSCEQLDVIEEAKLDDVTSKDDELVRLSLQNSDMTDRLATYISQLKECRDELKHVKDEYDAALLRISALTFENAQLRASINNEDNAECIKSNEKTNKIKQSLSNQVPYFNIRNKNNGYSDWN